MSLLPHHAELLKASAISDEVAKERGYYSAEKKSELEQLGFTGKAQRVPTLVIPVHGVVAGERPWFIHRPDEPRYKGNKAQKYEIPYRAKLKLDIHPRVRENLGSPDYPLFITEGSKKVDALISAGARAVIGVHGVFSFRGRNEDDGLTILPDWEWVHLKEGRRVFIVFDSDIILKQQVALAMNRMGAMLSRMGAEVAYTRLPSGEGGTKVGADDFLAAGGKLDGIIALSAEDPPKSPSSTEGGGGPEPRAQVHEAPEIASESDILQRFATDMGRLNHVGEEVASKLVYLSATSRLLDKIVSTVIKGPSAAGKSATVDRVIEFFSEEAYLSLTACPRSSSSTTTPRSRTRC